MNPGGVLPLTFVEKVKIISFLGFLIVISILPIIIIAFTR
jgi:hypothetical protein